MDVLLKFHFCIFLSLAICIYGNSANTTCLDSQKHFASLCFAPTPSLELDIEWSQASQPEDGWHLEIGNDIAKLHYAEALRGELLKQDDDFGNTCLRSKIEHGFKNNEIVADGTLYGYGNLTSKWDCNVSKDFPGVLNCDVASSLSKYHEYLHSYVTYSDNKNVLVSLTCFPNGQVGWTALSITKSLSEDEKKLVNEHITSLGFSTDDTVVLYDEAAC